MNEKLKREDLLSRKYEKTLKQYILQYPGWGKSAWKRIADVDAVVRKVGAKSVLDYGCGVHTLKTHLPKLNQVPVREYDPVRPGYDDMPFPADLVACLDVMEHVELDKVDAVLEHISDLAKKAAIFLVAHDKQGGARLPDGRWPHITVRPSTWWLAKIHKYFHTIEVLRDNDSHIALVAYTVGRMPKVGKSLLPRISKQVIGASKAALNSTI